jgi:glycosyltransferase domain-containing protein
MLYWSGLKATVYVIDGSPQAIPQSKMDRLHCNINYMHAPISLYERLRCACDLIETDYCVLLGDDEFFLPSALESCILELEGSVDLVSCMGRCLRFNYSPLGVTGDLAYIEMENYAILQDNPIDRMVSHMQLYTPSTIYSVVRASVWRKALTAMTKKEFPAFAVGELQFELAICYQGRSRIIPELMWLRSDEMPGIRGEDVSLKPENTFVGWWLDPANETERNELLVIMGNSLFTEEGNRDEISLGVRKALNCYVNTIPKKKQHIWSFQKFRNKIILHLPASLKTNLKYILGLFRKKNEAILLFKAASDLVGTGVTVNFKELSNIISIVNRFHAKTEELV